MKKITIKDFIEKAYKIHGNKYDYSKVEYNGNRNKICIICPEHGEFWQVAASHLRGNGCPKCGSNNSARIRTNNTDWFIKKAKAIHGGKYDYSKVDYVNIRTNVCIICPEHGEFWQTPLNHLNGHGCQLCRNKSVSDKLVSNTEFFIDKAKKIHRDKYDYSKVKYINARTKVCIICPEHGEFWQTPHDHLKGRGCCKCNESKLESKIRNLLEDNKINYIYQCRNNTLEWLGRQSLDFYLPDYNIAIECQGEQHYIEKEKNNLFGKLCNVVNKDIKKYKNCVEHNVGIIYFAGVDKIDNIEIYSNFNLFNDIEKIINFIKKQKK